MTPTSPPSRSGVSEAIAWAGAAVFVASLLWFLYCYMIRFDARRTEVAPPMALILDVAMFSIFALHHSLLARSPAKAVVQRWLPPAMERSAYTWAASLLFIAVCTWWQPIAGIAYTLQGPWRLAGHGGQVAAIVITLKAAAKLDILDLAGVRQIQHAHGGAPARMTLETSGLYGLVRHPLYFAWALFVLGAPDMTATRLTFAVVSTAYLAVAIRWEERGLVSAFGSEYEAYRRQVRWKMVPFLY